MIVQAGVSYDFKPHTGLLEFRYKRSINVSVGKMNSWSHSTQKVYCASEADFFTLINHWNTQNQGVRNYEALS